MLRVSRVLAMGTNAGFRRQFRLTVGIAGSSKVRPRLVELCTVCEIDEPRRCGEDAFVNVTARFPACIAVLDGVGGWGEIPGVDAGVVSHLLSNQLKNEFVNDRTLGASALLQKSYTNLKRIAPKDTVGSTTACVAVIQPDLNLDVVNLGDSGLFVVRGGAVVFQTRPTVEFPATKWAAAAPKQLAIVSAKHDPTSYISSAIQEGSTDNFKLETHDWVFAASDGILDNLLLPDQVPSHGLYKFSSILRLLTSNPEPSEVAQQLVTGCKRGPKVDDITAVVFRVDAVPQSAL